ncbi:MAG: ABC transporter permease [Deltaproteobacteria bacterium]|jgi:ABC-2 type transport system permease protein
MRNTLTIASRQFRSYFNGPVAYIVICLLLGVIGFFFWSPFFLAGRASVRQVFTLIAYCVTFAGPALTMGLLAEEKRSGTLELLITMPIREAEVIVGKFLAALGLWAVCLACTLPIPFAVSSLGDLDWGPVWSGYLGILLMGGAILAIGLMFSSFTDNQIVSFFLSLGVTFVFALLLGWMMPFMSGTVASIADFLSFMSHLESLARGVIDSRDVIYFLSITGFALMVAFRALESRRWS